MFDPVSPSSTPPLHIPSDAMEMAEAYLRLLHPLDGRGQVDGLIDLGGSARSFTWERDLLTAALPTLLEQDSYVAMNPFFGRRGGSRGPAELNAVFLDLDTYNVPGLKQLSRDETLAHIRDTLSDAGLPRPSVLIDSGRGFYAIWLLTGSVPNALPRWRAVMKALVKWARPFGADPACIDPARVLRLPGSWNDKIGRQVKVVGGTGTRVPFDALADSIWQAVGQPIRSEFDRSRQNRCARTDRDADSGPAKKRGLTRYEFWCAVREDLDDLLKHWGGTVPIGMRNNWLHVYSCALTWTSGKTDILDLVVERARDVAPGLGAGEVARMMRPTAKRGAVACSGRARGADPRYNYGGERLSQLLCVDSDLATCLGLRQVIPTELRKQRNARRRTERRRAAGIQSRANWEAVNPISRKEPWVALGIGRTTWYDHRRKERQARQKALVAKLLATSAALFNPGRTGVVQLYKGEALHAAPGGPVSGEIPDNLPPKNPRTSETTPKTTRTDRNRDFGTLPMPVSVSGKADPHHNSTIISEPTMTLPAINTTVLSVAARRLSPAELGALTCVALLLMKGPQHRRDVGRLAAVPPDTIDKLDGWLQVDETSGMVIDIKVAGLVPKPARRPRQGLLFDPGETASPAPVSSRNPYSLRAATINAGIRVLGRAGMSETLARTFLGQQLKLHEFGVLAEAIDAIERKVDDIADHRSWIIGFIRKRSHPMSSSAAGRPGRTGHFDGGKVVSAQKARPLATPEFLGLSKERAEMIRQQNAGLKDLAPLSSNRKSEGA